MLLCGAFSAFAQGLTVSGKVTSSDDGSGLPGVNILEKGTGNGTVTDSDGNFKITVGSNATLVFSFVGFSTQEITVGQQTTIDVSLKAEITSLNEVVVIGYGEVKKRDATGAVVSVKAEDFQKGVIASPEQLIQGKAAGVQVTSSSGEPGAGVAIRIRGTSSVRGGNNPLFVVDGIPLAGDDVSSGSTDLGRGTSSPKNPLNFLNPNDIESIDILKDASATAIYGSRGANGVVIITTKSGKGLKRQIEYSSSVSISTLAKKMPLLDRNGFLSAIARFSDPATSAATVAAQDFGANTDWQEEISRVAVSNKHTLSYGDNIKNGNFRAAFSYDNQHGVIKNTGLERITGRLNGNRSFLDNKLKLGVQLTFSRINDRAALISNNSGYEGDLIGASYMANPTWPSSPGGQFVNSNANPNALLKYYDDNTKTDRHLINVSLAYDITPELNIKVNTGFDRSSSTRGAAISPLLYIGNGVYGNGRAGLSDVHTESNLLEAFLNYKKELGPGSFTALLGYSYQRFANYGANYQGYGFSNNNLATMVDNLTTARDIAGAALSGKSYQQYGYDAVNSNFFMDQLFPTPQTNVAIAARPTIPVHSVTGDLYNYVDELQSYFARANYAISSKYLATATIRADGSTKFGGNNKTGIFPSGALAWKLSEEAFIPEFFDDLKLRVGYGVTGNQSIPHNLYQQRQRFGGMSIQQDGKILVPSLNTVAFDNPDLKWEQTKMYNAGLDFAFFNSKIIGTVDVYRKETTNLLLQVYSTQPAPQPFNWLNLDAIVVNKGVELTLAYHAIDKENAGLSFAFNGSYNDNMVTKYSGVTQTGAINGQGLSGELAEQIAQGHPLYSFYLRDFQGFGTNDTPGHPKGIYNHNDQRKYFGSPLPKYNAGLTINARFRNWDASIFFNAQTGQYVYNNTALAFFNVGSIVSGRNVTTNALYTGESRANTPDVNSLYLEKGDFCRLQNLNFGYNFKLEEGSVFKKVRLSLSGQNLYVWTNYSGRDPEVNVDKNINGVPSAGIDYTGYPRAKTYTLSLSATF
jgi:iron complex outermembrane receptor protein